MTDKKIEQQTETKAKKTRFSGIADKRGKLPVEPELEPESEVAPEPAPMPAPAAPAPVAVVSAPPPAAQPVSAKPPRQPGKKDNPDYVQVTVYLRKEIYRTARKFLIDEDRQVSELVDDLVSSWISSRK